MKAELERLDAILSPATPPEIMACIGKLLLHYPMTNMTEKEKTLLLEDYLDDLGHYPAWALAEVCREYRLNAENQYFPKVAVLVDMLRKNCGEYEKSRVNIRNILALPAPNPGSPLVANLAAELAEKMRSGRNVL